MDDKIKFCAKWSYEGMTEAVKRGDWFKSRL
jgi:hypothetical protein